MILFADRPDLIKNKNFRFFLPDDIDTKSNARLDAAVKEAEDRARETQQQESVPQVASQMAIGDDNGLILAPECYSSNDGDR